MKPEYAKQAAAACSMLRSCQEHPFIRHETEELVEILCCSEDPGLRGLGLRLLEHVRMRDPDFRIVERR